FCYERNKLVVRPMKGTRPRGRSIEEDIFLRKELENSEKEKAENLMIVDLLRNDLGKISEFGEVKVSSLFNIEPYMTVWQMTSEINSFTRSSLVEVFRALFPSGSVTGAPKIYAMKLINQLERYSRGVYCGSAGIIFPGLKAVFNVAIRTMLYNYETHRAYYYVGSGIVWDSDPLEEWRECEVKAHIITKTPEPFSLLETIRVENGDPFLLDYHLNRLEWSAYRFGYPFEREYVERSIMNVCRSMSERLYRLRVELLPSGKVNLQYPLKIGPTRLRIGLARENIDKNNIMLYHKTSFRDVYNLALSTRPDCEDVLLWNEEGYITESTIANVVVVMDGIHYTPPVECGLLPGTYRQYLIDTGKVVEKKIHKEVLASVDKIYLINSVRKEIDVEWID
ncbi:MAG: chorismate-binding protein, partial [Candidatus Hydrogenedentes bacterium]|nr:chorismate-binding protein [Candidatus Hydrogenedentota bacterium]